MPKSLEDLREDGLHFFGQFEGLSAAEKIKLVVEILYQGLHGTPPDNIEVKKTEKPTDPQEPSE